MDVGVGETGLCGEELVSGKSTTKVIDAKQSLSLNCYCAVGAKSTLGLVNIPCEG